MPPAQPGDRARGQRETMLVEVGEGIERRLRVARAGQRAGEIARLVAQALRFLPEKGLEQAQQRAPALHRPAEIVHRLGLGFRRILDGRRAPRRGCRAPPPRNASPTATLGRKAGLSFI